MSTFNQDSDWLKLAKEAMYEAHNVSSQADRMECYATAQACAAIASAEATTGLGDDMDRLKTSIAMLDDTISRMPRE